MHKKLKHTDDPHEGGLGRNKAAHASARACCTHASQGASAWHFFVPKITEHATGRIGWQKIHVHRPWQMSFSSWKDSGFWHDMHGMGGCVKFLFPFLVQNFSSYLCRAENFWWRMRVVGGNGEWKGKFPTLPETFIRAQCDVEIHNVVAAWQTTNIFRIWETANIAIQSVSVLMWRWELLIRRMQVCRTVLRKTYQNKKTIYSTGNFPFRMGYVALEAGKYRPVFKTAGPQKCSTQGCREMHIHTPSCEWPCEFVKHVFAHAPGSQIHRFTLQRQYASWEGFAYGLGNSIWHHLFFSMPVFKSARENPKTHAKKNHVFVFANWANVTTCVRLTERIWLK